MRIEDFDDEMEAEYDLHQIKKMSRISKEQKTIQKNAYQEQDNDKKKIKERYRDKYSEEIEM